MPRFQLSGNSLGSARVFIVGLSLLWAGRLAAGPLETAYVTLEEAPDLESRIVLRWMDAHRLFPRVQKVTSRVTAMFTEMNTEVRWVEGDEGALDSPQGIELRVVLMPSESGGSDWRLQPNVLGVVVLEEEESDTCPTVYIFYPNVVRTLGLDPASNVSMMAPRAHRDISRVLSRVILHEVVHAVTRHASHSAAGVMKARLSPSYLMRRRAPGLDATERSVFVAALRRIESEKVKAIWAGVSEGQLLQTGVARAQERQKH